MYLINKTNMRNLVDLYLIILDILIKYKEDIIPIDYNGLCIFPLKLVDNFSLITGKESYTLQEDLDKRLSILPNVYAYPCYRWIPMKTSRVGIQERIDFIQSIINELENNI